MSAKCPQCDKELPTGAPNGLCPACLLKQGLASATLPDAPAFQPPTPEELAPHFPQLEILELLGRGGMGVVYKARQKELDRLVALKILNPSAAEATGFAERFTREARALASLSHPGIVAVHDFGQNDGIYWVMMEFIDGVNLRHLIRGERMTPREAVAIVPQLCEALQYAHDEGIVHRDIKPENILLDKKGRVKIADFGLAKILGQQPSDLTLTGAGDRVGTPHYMAPEQVESSQEVDNRADIYSLGVVFYEMLTGELPLGRFAPPSRKVEIDVRLDEVVLRALEKEPELRFQQASYVGTEVQTILSSPNGNDTDTAPEATQDVPPPPPPNRPTAGADAIPDAGRGRGNRVCGIISVILAVVNGLGLFWSVFALIYLRPKFMAVFADLDAELPTITRILFQTPFAVVLMAVPILLALLVAKEFIRIKVIPLILNILWLGSGLALATLLYWALVAPAVQMVEQVDIALQPELPAIPEAPPAVTEKLAAGEAQTRVRLEFRRAEHEPGEGLTEVIEDGSGRRIWLHEEAELSNEHIASARVPQDNLQVVDIALTEEGARRFATLTREHSGKRLAILLDGKMISAPVIREEITGGRAVLSGNFSPGEAKRIAAGLARGPWPPEPRDTWFFGPVIESIVHHQDSGNCFVDLDTGKLFPLPDPPPATAKESLALFAKLGIDAMHDPSALNLAGVEMVAIEVLSHMWDVPATAITAILEAGTPGTPANMSAKGELPATFLFRTREGGRGLLQIVERQDDPAALKIRWKLLCRDSNGLALEKALRSHVEAGKELVLSITEEGGLTFAGRAVVLDDIEAMSHRSDGLKDATVLIQAHRSVKHMVIKSALDALNKAGAAEIGLTTMEEGGGRSEENAEESPTNVAADVVEKWRKTAREAVKTIAVCAETDPRVKGSMDSLKGMGEDVVVDEVASFLDSKRNTQRRAAIYVLWQGGFADIGGAGRKLVELCSHEEEFTRGMAALCLGQNKVAGGFDTLVGMTREDKSAYARRCGAYALGLLGDPKAIPPLEEALKDADPNVRNNADAALGMLEN